MRWIFRIFGALLMALIVLVGGVFLLPGEKIANVALEQIRAATGREVSFEGDVELSWYPVLGVKAGKVTIANADWSENGPMLTAEALSVGVETAPLFSGQIRIRALEIEAPDLLLERRADGRGNWEIGSGEAGAGGRQLALSLDRVVMTGGHVRYLDHSDGSRQAFNGLDAELKAPDLAGRAELSLAMAMAEGQGKAELDAVIDGLAGFLGGEAVPVRADLGAGGGTLHFEGRAGTSGDAAGAVTADLPEVAKFAAALGLGAVAPPQGFGRRIGAEGQIVLTRGQELALRQMALRLDQNAMTLDADMDFSAGRPHVTARIKAGVLDFSTLGGGESGGGGEGWSTARIDAGALAAVNGSARLTAQSIDLGDLKLGASDIGMTLDRSRAVFTLAKLDAYEGSLGGEFVINNRSGLSVGGDLRAEGVETKTLLGDMAGITRLSGKAGGRLKFLGVGQSMDAIMKSLSGEGALEMGQGHIAGFDLDKLMRSGNGSGGTTIFDTLDASFTLEKGNMRNSDLKLLLPNVEATGKGRIGLGARDIDYLFTPVALKARDGKGLAIPVRIKGPWSGPKITPDLGAAVDLNFAEEKKELEDKAKAEVQKKLEEKLDMQVEEGQSLEDAVKQKAEEELLRGLQNLLK